MSYLEGWESATWRLDAKCGKGWQPGPGGKCVRSKPGLAGVGVGALGIAGAGLAYGAIKGRKGKENTPMKQLPPAKNGKKTSYKAPSNLEESVKGARAAGVKEKDILKNVKEVDDFFTKSTKKATNSSQLIDQFGKRKSPSKPDNIIQYM